MKLPIAIITGLLLTGSVQASTAESMLPNNKAETYNLGIHLGECKMIRIIGQFMGAGPELKDFLSLLAKEYGHDSMLSHTMYCNKVLENHKRILSAQ